MFSKILVANRGEIAVRIFRTCREMGIATVAVCSDIDKNAVHTGYADQVVVLGGDEPAVTYLDIGKIIKAAKDTGAEALHPGYGFLAESPRLAAACEQAGIAFIGPRSDVLALVGDKLAARRLAKEAGVQPTAGTETPGANYKDLIGRAEKLGYPVMIKAAAGGGGKGMRKVDGPEALAEALELAAGEAENAFGDSRLFLERFIENAHHVEVQLLADRYGNMVHLFERECSIQRRHQKIIEEGPSPAVDDELRGKLCRAAMSVARAAGYTNAGTVEFLLDEKGGFSFMEVNARLQVEHPVTELITGVDLVEQQIRIAAGETLSLSQQDLSCLGHAIECRIYAEDPANDFLPSPGTIELMEAPHGPGVRFDSGIMPGSIVPVDYDPILAKLIVFAAGRDKAAARMAGALTETCILGVKTPVEMMIDIVKSKEFMRAETSTDFMDRYFKNWRPSEERGRIALLGWLAAQLANSEQEGGREPPGGPGGVGHRGDPWQKLRNFRLWGQEQ
ncbi:MAG: ATP-grasp domain-containing protein [Deltaproteobacteria bacterium]|nr:ATP-grasp domain-containing protein [Deltaproteobacteria bacterium]